VQAALENAQELLLSSIAQRGLRNRCGIRYLCPRQTLYVVVVIAKGVFDEGVLAIGFRIEVGYGAQVVPLIKILVEGGIKSRQVYADVLKQGFYHRTGVKGLDQGLGAAIANQTLAVDVVFIALSVPAEVVVIVQD